MPTIRTAAGKAAELTPTEADTNMKQQATAQASNYNLTAAHNRDFHELANGVVATLPTASSSLTETDDWEVTLKAVGTSATVGRNSQNIDGAASDLTLVQNEVVTVVMNAAQTGFYIKSRWYDLASHQSAAASGYQKLPGGLILQWGTFSTGNIAAATAYNSWGIATGTLTYPVAFASACYSINFNPSGSAAGYIVAGSYGVPGTTTCAWFAQNATSSIQSATLYWMAIGK